MLSDKKLKAFIPTVEPKKAKNFYMNVLGLELLSEDKFALEFNVNGGCLRINTVNELHPHPFTVLGWGVDNIVSLVVLMQTKGVIFEKYDFFVQDNIGIWTSPDGTKVAWFKDPDGNLLSLSENQASSK
jgi:hypothetical protein